uniref:Putative reverse transcriptase n=1 Tax=Climaconeis cf. scalaris TaxID=2846828 RepID=A0A8F8X858_9STRA|nr:putative reverse transcriptase [Climaconeis cf. scalaris]QYB19333.1 putative reverse transcriptase [Climaconeis cf. scalaris]
MSSLAWKNINWSLVNSRIQRYQTRIFKASKENNIYKIRCIQKRLLNSLDAKLVAVRRVTTLNNSKIIAGIEKRVFITDLQKEKLVRKLRLDGKALSIRHLSIDKTGKAEKCPLSISIAKDRAKEALCLLALEPEWEAKFEINSYGFRPGRCCHDVIETILLSLRNHSGENHYHKYILEGTISKWFDQIDHEYLVEKLNTLPEMESHVKTWLKVGVLEDFLDINKKTNTIENIMARPQGEIIFPLLTNIALHGLEDHMKEWICTKSSFAKTSLYPKSGKRKNISVIRYENDFIIIHQDKTIINEAKKEIYHWLLNGPHLKLNEEKTSIRNSNEGFNFLGFTFITIQSSNKTRAKIYPSRKSQELLILKVRNVIQRNRNVSAYNLISVLRPIIIGWANYFRYSECKKCFQKLTHLIFQQLRAWVFRRDTRNGRKEVKQRYFPSGKEYYFGGRKHKDNWVLNGKTKDKNGNIQENWLPHLTWVKNEKWVQIKIDKSPFDGDNLYWRKRIIIRVNCNLR